MGFLRIYLALCVIEAHANEVFPWVMHSGYEAVEIFFMISGFYMALIANRYASALEFYFSRFLRIYIPYWVVLICILIFCTVSGMIIGEWGVLDLYRNYSPDKNGLAGVIITAISNITIFFQDTVMFLTDDGGQKLSFTYDFGSSKHPLWLFLVIPQAWSISVELMFYLILPFLAKLRSSKLMIILIFSLLLRVFVYQHLGLTNDPWNYRLFPLELALFIAGMLSCRFYLAHGSFISAVTDKLVPQKVYGAIFYVIILFILFFVMKNFTLLLISCRIKEIYAVLVSYIVWACLLPFLFAISKSLKWDRVVGELSYPVYLLHVFVISVVGVLLKTFTVPDVWLGKVSAIFSLFAAWLIFAIVIKPLDKHRHVMAKNMAAACYTGLRGKRAASE